MASRDQVMLRVPYVDIAAQSLEEGEALRARIATVLEGGDFVNGPEVAEFERAVASYAGVEYAVAVNSGTDALLLAMRAIGIGPGDEVITPPNSFVTSTSSIVMLGATPVFADVLPDHNIDPAKIAEAMTPRTKAIMPVHLSGLSADMDAIGEYARRHGLLVVEDAAQSIGSRLDGRLTGTWGDVGCFSAHPLKNLNACGDGGYVLTDDEAVADRVRVLRNAGLVDRDTMVTFAGVSRMDSIQAAILTMRLDGLSSVIERRRANAALYRRLLVGAHVFVPAEDPRKFDSYHTFVIEAERRDALQAFLSVRGIETAIHYPIPIHLQPGARQLDHRRGDFPVTERQADRILSLPIHQFLVEDQICHVAESINAFYSE